MSQALKYDAINFCQHAALNDTYLHYTPSVNGAFCQIINNMLQIILPKFYQTFFIERFTLTMDPKLMCCLNLFQQYSKYKSGGPAPNPSKSGGPKPMRFIRFLYPWL